METFKNQLLLCAHQPAQDMRSNNQYFQQVHCGILITAPALKANVQFYLQGSWLPKASVMACRIPYLVGAVARVHTLNGSFPHQNVVFFSPFQHLHV